MTDDRELVIRFFRFKGIDARHFPRGKEGKKTDFALYLGEAAFAFCEMKSLLDYDPADTKIQKKIHEASIRMKAANPDHKVPNIIFFINHTDKASWKELWYVLTGQTIPPNRTTEQSDRSSSKKRVQKGALSAIDYIIWAETFESTIFYVINQRSEFREALEKNISATAHEKIDIRSV